MRSRTASRRSGGQHRAAYNPAWLDHLPHLRSSSSFFSHLGRFKRESNVSINYIGALSRTHSENCLSFGSFSNELRLDPV